MKIKDALEIGLDCGLETVSEAIFNIELHAMNIFNYDKIKEEFEELAADYKALDLKPDMLISDVLRAIGGSENEL